MLRGQSLGASAAWLRSGDGNMNYAIWIPTFGDQIIFRNPPFVFQRMLDVSRTKSSPLTSKGPFQVGTTLLDNDVDARTFAVQSEIIAQDYEQLQALKAQLIRSLAIETSHNANPMTGYLRYYREGLSPVEIECTPVDSPEFGKEGFSYVSVYIEMYAPNPFWTETGDRSHTFMSEGGTEYPLEYPLEYVSSLSKATIDNMGDVSTPPRWEIIGPVLNPMIRNETTGEELGLITLVEAGERIIIETAFGRKRITRIKADGTEEDAFGTLNLQQSSFFHFRRGAQIVSFEFEDNFGQGFARAYWRQAYAGV